MQIRSLDLRSLKGYGMEAICIGIQACVMVGGYEVVKAVQKKYNCSGLVGEIIRKAESIISTFVILWIYGQALSEPGTLRFPKKLHFDIGIVKSCIPIGASILAKIAIIAGARIKGALSK